MSLWCFLITLSTIPCILLLFTNTSLDESLDENTSSSNTKIFFPVCLELLLLCSGMLMVMLVRALNVEAGCFVFVSKDVFVSNGTVLGGCWIVSAAVLVGSTGRVIVEVSLAFLLAFAAASLFLISFLSWKSFSHNSFCISSSCFDVVFSIQSSSVNTNPSMITLGDLLFSPYLTGHRLSARSGDINP